MSKVVVIDPGHGGSDSGATGGGLQEKNLTLKIAKRIENKLKNYDVTVRMTRSNDKTMSLKDRTDFANKIGADYFASIHINAGGGTGYEDYIYNGLRDSGTTGKMRATVHEEVNKLLGKHGIKNRGKMKANFHVLRETKMSAMLSENLFIDTEADQQFLKNGNFLNALGDAVARGIANALGLNEKG